MTDPVQQALRQALLREMGWRPMTAYQRPKQENDPKSGDSARSPPVQIVVAAACPREEAGDAAGDVGRALPCVGQRLKLDRRQGHRLRRESASDLHGRGDAADLRARARRPHRDRVASVPVGEYASQPNLRPGAARLQRTAEGDSPVVQEDHAPGSAWATRIDLELHCDLRLDTERQPRTARALPFADH